MFLKWVKALLIVSLAAATTGLMVRFMNITSASFSMAFNFLLMFWVAVFESQVKPALDSPYFDTYPFEKQGKIYRMLGVEWYRAILVKSGWEKLRQQTMPISKSHQAFLAYERGSRVAEAGHLVVGIIVLIVTGYVAFTYSFRAIGWLVLFNLFLNVYPVLLQRYTRPRLRRMIAKFRAAEGSLTFR